MFEAAIRERMELGMRRLALLEIPGRSVRNSSLLFYTCETAQPFAAGVIHLEQLGPLEINHDPNDPPRSR